MCELAKTKFSCNHRSTAVLTRCYRPWRHNTTSTTSIVLHPCPRCLPPPVVITSQLLYTPARVVYVPQPQPQPRPQAQSVAASQQIPGPGSRGQALAVPANATFEDRPEWRNGKLEMVRHYTFPNGTSPHTPQPPPPPPAGGWNPAHGNDSGPLPPGWGRGGPVAGNVLRS